MITSNRVFYTIRTACAAATVIGMALSANAQGPGGPGGPHRRHGAPDRLIYAVNAPMPMLDRTLKLTDDERSKIESIQDQFQESIHSLMPPRPRPGATPPAVGDRKAAETKIETIAKQAGEKVMAALTADQQKTLTRVLADLNDFRLVHIPYGAAKDLKLTPDQRSKVADIAAKTRKEIKAIRDASSDPRADHDKIAEILKSAGADTRKLMTESQKTALDTFLNDHPMRGRGGDGPKGPDAGPRGRRGPGGDGPDGPDAEPRGRRGPGGDGPDGPDAGPRGRRGPGGDGPDGPDAGPRGRRGPGGPGGDGPDNYDIEDEFDIEG